MGGFRVQAKSAELAEQLLTSAQKIEEAGAFAIVLEGIPREVAKYVTSQLSIPTIGIGAGPECSGQVLVFHDALGLHDGKYAKFVRRYHDGWTTQVDALRHYIEDVQESRFPSEEESYHLKDEEAEKLHLYSN
jgi:3-methyl-2-oxobutanoate hydroxymethyltransferase